MYFLLLQAMRFGDLPGWAVELSSSIHEVILFGNCAAELENSEKGKEVCIFPQDLLWREPLFDQLIVNMYQPGEVRLYPFTELFLFSDKCIIIVKLLCYRVISTTIKLDDAV